jgi:predicted ATPase/DNA-binding winged helix-turn-helix (wHTH) protein
MAAERNERAEQERGGVAVFGPFRLFPTARRLERDGKPVEIGGRALDILVELVNQAGRVVSKVELMSTIWADITVVEGVLRTHIYNLRRALGDGVDGARYVTSVAGRGYCFVAPVVRGPTEATTRAIVKNSHRLPPPLARMAGRDDVVRKLADQILEDRFVTIVGAAGIGKTTVAVALGHVLLDDFSDAVRFIELGSLTDAALVAATVAASLGVRTQTDDALDSLRAFLQDKRVLLVLDNCEHVVEAAAALAEHLFLGAPSVHLLATSREALRVEGEHAHHLSPLEGPTDFVGMSAETVQTFPAVQVFLERAAASGWAGDLTDNDVPIVAETCRRLDGVPLAIELAASFVGQWGLQGMAAALDDRLRLLWQRGRRTAPARQQTIHALVAWSYDRLPERERVALRRLSVLVGPFPFDTAKAVVLEDGDSGTPLLELLNELVGKSLLSAGVEEGYVVYRLLETTRVYALERLAEAGELERISLRHAQRFAEHAECRADLGNVRAALKWSFSSPSGHSIGARLTAAASRILLDLGLMTECHDWCRHALDVVQECDRGTLVELDLLDALATSAMFSTRGLGKDVRSAVTRGLKIARALGSDEYEVRLLGQLNALLIRAGDWGDALEVATQSMTAARRYETAEPLRAHLMLALSHHCLGNQVLAQEHCEEGLRLATTSREEPLHFRRPQVLLTLARTLWLRGHADRAVEIARQVMADEASLRHPVDKCLALLLCEPIFIWRGEWDEAQRLLDIMDKHVERYALTSHRGVAMGFRGELLVKIGRPQEGCELLRAADSRQKAVRNASHATYVARALAEGLAAIGSIDEALVTVTSGIYEAQRRGGTWDLPELLSLKGVLQASRSPMDPCVVDEALSAAMELAQRQGALALELRATMALARERVRRGGAADGLVDLAAIYAKFTEGMQTADLRAARSLLERRKEPRGGAAPLVKQRQPP